jgi:hypothetical protein
MTRPHVLPVYVLLVCHAGDKAYKIISDNSNTDKEVRSNIFDNWTEASPPRISKRVAGHDPEPLHPFPTVAASFPNIHVMSTIFLPGLPGGPMQRNILPKFCMHFFTEPAVLHV